MALVQAGADLSLTGELNKRPLDLAVEQGHEATTSFLRSCEFRLGLDLRSDCTQLYRTRNANANHYNILLARSSVIIHKTEIKTLSGHSPPPGDQFHLYILSQPQLVNLPVLSVSRCG